MFRPFHPATGERLHFTTALLRGVVDTTTGTSWSITGEGLDGKLAGLRLEPVAEAYVAFWGAWAAFNPDTRLWKGDPRRPHVAAPEARSDQSGRRNLSATARAKSLPAGDW